ncbi:MAG TPA: anti-sigma factor [Thermoanaerobaculia bacterium]|nr:anti-sigma factor [Thermoanaerobaculia bacterium]
MAASSHSPRFEEMLPAYALGALDGEDLRELETHLTGGCPQCRDLLRIWEGDVEALADLAPPLEPSRMTRERVLRSLEPRTGAAASGGAVVAAREERRRRGAPRWLWAAAAVLLVIAGWASFDRARLRGEVAELAAERDRLAARASQLDQQLALTQAEAARMAQALQVVAAPGARSVALAGLDPAPQASGRTFVDPESRRAVFYASNLPALEPGKTYQLWFIPEGQAPVSAGVFGVDPRGAASVPVEGVAPVDGIQLWAVTVEPAGGVPAPTGAMVLKS